MNKDIAEIEGLIANIRRCFWLLGAVSDELIGDMGLTASTRAVLEHLHEFGPQTVPQIASEKMVKRQSIQTLVDHLRTAGFAAVVKNPAHRRSVLVTLTPQGRSVFRKVRSREAKVLSELVKVFRSHDLTTSATALVTLNSILRSRLLTGKNS